MNEMWENQKEALDFALEHPAVMLNMDMGTGKTRVAIEAVFARQDVKQVLVVCPKAVVPVWRQNLLKFKGGSLWACWDASKGTVAAKSERIKEFTDRQPYLDSTSERIVQFVIVNYDIVWRFPLSEMLRNVEFDMVILDESHRAKSAGSKVSKFLALLGKRVKYKMCLSGTPMANSPLDVYGQYRFLDPSIFGTRFDQFRDEYAILGGPERRFIVGFKNQKRLNNKFQSIAYTCKMSDVSDRLKLPEKLPPTLMEIELPARDMKTIKQLHKEFVAECGEGNFVVLKNVLGLCLREQQICSGYTVTTTGPGEPEVETELNTSKAEAFQEYLDAIDPREPVVVFYVFKHDARSLRRACEAVDRPVFELSGDLNQLYSWQEYEGGGVLIVQIQSGAEGVDMTKATRGVYYSLPHSLALYEQSMARLYRPGQTNRVQFTYLLAKDTIDEGIYSCLVNKKSLIDGIQSGLVNMDYIKKG